MGRAFLEQGLWLDADPASYLPMVRSIDMGAWGGQVLFAILESLGGLGAVQFLIAIVAALSHVLVLSLAWRPRLGLVTALFAVAVFAACSFHRWRGRPDIFSLLFFLLILKLLTRPASRKDLLLYFLTCLCWINLHPGAILAPMFAALAAFGGQVGGRLRQALAALIAISLTPRGPLETWKLVRQTAATGPLVPEWQALWKQEFNVVWVEWITLVLLLSATVWLGRGAWRRSKGCVALAAFAVFMALGSLRLLYMILALTTLWQGSTSKRQRQCLVVVTVFLVLALPLNKRWIWFQRCRDLGASPFVALYEPHYPVGAASFIAQYGLEGRLFHPVTWGGYLGLELTGKNQSAHDGRISLWGYDLAADLLDHRSAQRRAVLRERYGFEIIVEVPGALNPDEFVASGGRWLPVYSDIVAAVYLDVHGKHGSANKKRLSR